MRATIYRWGQVLLVFLFLTTWALLATGQDKSKKPKHPDVAVSPIQVQLSRAWVKARSNDEGATIRRMVVTPGTRENYESATAIFFFQNGDFGIFQGGDEASTDSWIYLSKEQKEDFQGLVIPK